MLSNTNGSFGRYHFFSTMLIVSVMTNGKQAKEPSCSGRRDGVAYVFGGEDFPRYSPFPLTNEPNDNLRCNTNIKTNSKMLSRYSE